MEADTFAAREAALESELLRLRDPQERLSWVITRAASQPGLDPAQRIEAHEVKGCASRLWLVCTREGDRCGFRVDSESAILKALSGLLCELYDGLPAREVTGQEPRVLDRVGLLALLTENRRRTLTLLRAAIRTGAGDLHPPGMGG